MPADHPTSTPGEYSAAELDDLFAVLADWRRRAVIEHLSETESASVRTLAERIARERGSLSTFEAKIALLHDQLPHLEQAGVIDLDLEDRRCELARTRRIRTLQRLLATVREEG